ncbi:MAG: hypothetical protein RL275_2984, partial [Chloroflexota bacterium]
MSKVKNSGTHNQITARVDALLKKMSLEEKV